MVPDKPAPPDDDRTHSGPDAPPDLPDVVEPGEAAPEAPAPAAPAQRDPTVHDREAPPVLDVDEEAPPVALEEPPAPPPPPPIAPNVPEAAPKPPGSDPQYDPDKTEIVPSKQEGDAEALLFRRRPTAGDRYPVRGSQMTIGRSRQCQVKLRSDSSHREHARLLRHDDDWYVVPWEAKKVVFADGRMVKGEKRLEHGMVLTFGGDELEYRVPGADVEEAPPDVQGKRVVAPRKRGRFLRALPWILVGLVAAAALIATGAIAVVVLQRGGF